MTNWKTLFPPDRPQISLAAPDGNPFTFEGSAAGYLSPSNYNDTYPVYLQAGYEYDFVTVNSGEGTGVKGRGLYGVWTDILIYDGNGDLLAINRESSPDTVGYNGDIWDFSVSVSGTYYVSESMYFTWDSGDYYLAINVEAPAGGGATPATELGSGNDSHGGLTSAELVRGNDGHDTIYGMEGADTLMGGGGEDNINGNMGADLIQGGDGSDWLLGGKDNDLVEGGAGDDLMVNGNNGNDTVRGGDGTDLVHGGKDDDQVYGEAGDDWINGDLGNDTLWGGSGIDWFEFGADAGTNTIGDFSAADGDRILIPAGATWSVAAAASGAALVSLSAGGSVELTGIAAGQVDAGWFMATP